MVVRGLHCVGQVGVGTLSAYMLVCSRSVLVQVELVVAIDESMARLLAVGSRTPAWECVDWRQYEGLDWEVVQLVLQLVWLGIE